MVRNTKHKINTKALILRSGVLLCGIVCGLLYSSIAISAPTKPSCADLEYNMDISDEWKCNYKYFHCPLDSEKIKCDKMATVGDIKYSKNSSESEDTGWLLCDGSTYDATKYPQLASLIGTKFADNDDNDTNDGQYLLPNYIGLFLRGKGSQTINDISYSSTEDFYHIQNQSIPKHKHQIKYQTYQCSVKNIRRTTSSSQYTGSYPVQKTIKFSLYENDNGTNLYCPVRFALYPYIYAGALGSENG